MKGENTEIFRVCAYYALVKSKKAPREKSHGALRELLCSYYYERFTIFRYFLSVLFRLEMPLRQCGLRLEYDRHYL